MKTLSLALAALLAAPLAATPALAAPAPAAFLIAEYDASSEESLAEGREAMEAGNFEQALSSFQDALSSNPGDKKLEALVKEAQTKASEAYVEKGTAKLAEHDWVAAEQEFDNALDIDKESAAAKKGKASAMNGPKADNYVKEAKARAAKGDFDYAVGYFQKAYDLVADPETKKLLDEAKAHKKK